MFNKNLENKIDSLEQQVMELKKSVPQINSISNTVTLPKDIFVNDEEKKKAAYALNLVTVSVSQIVDYEDLVVLEQEYDAILNNINLENIIHDEPLLDILKQILDVITFFKIQAKDKEFVERKYQQKMKNAIWSAVPNIGLIVAGGDPVTMALSLASQVGIGYMNYRKEKANSSLEKDEQMWQLQKSAIEQLNGLRRELFSTAWKLADRYKFKDELRLTEKQINQYNKILMDNDLLRRFERLDVMKKDFEAFPPFWYQLGHTAKEIADNAKNNDEQDIFKIYKDKALESYKRFNAEYIELMREDVIYSACALEQIPLLIDGGCDKTEIKNLLNNAIRLAGSNFDILQQTILVSLYLNDTEAAKNVLRRLVNEDYNTAFNAQLLSKIYINEKNKAEYDLLSERVESIGSGNYLLPYPEENESEAEQNEEFYEQQKINLKMQLTEFFNRFIEKSRVECLRLIPSLADESDLFFKKDNFLEVAKRKVYNDMLFDGFDLFENYVQLLNRKCENLLGAENNNFNDMSIDKIFENDTERDGDTIEEVANLISINHIGKIKNAIKDEVKKEDVLMLLNWNNDDTTSPSYLFNQYCKFICEKIDNLEIKDIEQSEYNVLSNLDSAISKLYMTQGWAVPYYDKTNQNAKNNTKGLIVSNINDKMIEGQKRKKRKIAFIKDSLDNLKPQKDSVIQNPMQIKTFIQNNKKLNDAMAKHYSNVQQPVAIIKTKKDTAFLLFADYFWYCKKGGSLCFEYSYELVVKNYTISDSGDSLMVNVKMPSRAIITYAKWEKIHPVLTSDDVNIIEFEKMINKLAGMM